MSAFMFLTMIAKAVTTAVVVLCAAKTAEVFGPRWGAIVASLPVSAGPAYVFLAMEHPAEFVASSALTSAVGNAATGLFLLCYGTLARRTSIGFSLAASIAVWLGVAIPAQFVPWTLGTVAALNIVAYGSAIAIARILQPVEVAVKTSIPGAWFDLPIRAALIAVFVCLVVAGSKIAGPTATGIAAVFPLSLTSLLLLMRARIGAPATAAIATNALMPMLGFGAMLILLHLAIPRLGVPSALGISLLFSLLWSTGLVVFAGRRRV